ncbi:MAG: RES family NAD+ phosphorylase [Chloroflexi bacterium]|nr:RES family NAD+ phosphorylase [Chloroflexota bacterium]
MLWRIHGDGHGAAAFRDTGAEIKRVDPRMYGNEGRFDCQAGEYGYLYAAETKASTIVEAFLRGQVVRDATARFLRRARLTERVLSRVRLTTELPLVDLRGAAGLGRVGQDAWLSACDEEDYPITQQWAAALRRWAPGAAGLAWMSKRDNLQEVVVLLSDRIPAGAITAQVERRLDSPLGVSLMQKVLAEFNVTLGGS